MSGPPYRDYLPGNANLPPRRRARPHPRPGHGTVFLVRLEGHLWAASWQDAAYPAQDGGPAGAVEDFEGPVEAVLQWARSRPAERVLYFSSSRDEYTSLPSSLDLEF